MTVLHTLPFKFNSAIDQPTSDEQNQRDDGPNLAGDTKSAGWTVTDPPPLPKAREPKEILYDLRNLDFTSNAEVTKLAREKLFAPQVMLRLTEDYYVCFGGPGLVRAPMKMEKNIHSRDIHPTLSAITKPDNPAGRFLPSVVFDIGRLSLKTDDAAPEGSTYQPTDYRVVLDIKSGGIWLFYEYYKLDPDDLVEKIEFSMNETMEKRVGKKFVSAKVLSSVKDWNDDLNVTAMETNMKESCNEVHAYIAPALSNYVEEQLKSSPKRRIISFPPLRTQSSKPKEKVRVSIQEARAPSKMISKVRSLLQSRPLRRAGYENPGMVEVGA